MSLRAKFKLMVGVAAVSLIALSVCWIQNQHSTLLSEKMQKTKNLVEVPYTLIEHAYELEQGGKLTRQEAQQRVIAEVRSIRYDGSNYFWINDEQPTMILHPMKPELDGKDLSSRSVDGVGHVAARISDLVEEIKELALRVTPA